MTSIGRPLDPRYKTNRAVQWLMPIAGVAAGIVRALGGGDLTAIALAALGGALVVIGSWALARELAPDDQPAAFIGMALAFASLWLVDEPSLLLPFVAIFLVRIVNRSTGLSARISDSILVLLLSLWATWHLHSPFLGFVAAFAFAADALLSDGLPRQWVFAGLSVAGGGFALALDPLAGIRLPDLGPTLLSAVCALSALWLLNIALTRSVASTGDIGGQPLSIARVRTGMLIGWLCGPAVGSSALIWAILAALLVGRLQCLVRGREDPEDDLA